MKRWFKKKESTDTFYNLALDEKEALWLAREIRGNTWSEGLSIAHKLKRATLHVKASKGNDYVQDVLMGTKQ